jgi:predicted amidophosphoribosyltransferase
MKAPTLSRFTKLSLVLTGVLLLVWLSLTLFAGSPSSKTEAVVTDEKHCPTCGRPLPRHAIARKECPYCLLERGPEAAKFGDKNSAGANKAVPITIISLFVLLLIANIASAVYGRVRKQKIEALFHYWCPKCGRKLRYRESQIGRLANCPLCERPIVFPRPEGLVDSRWTKLRRWLHLTSPHEKRKVGS